MNDKVLLDEHILKSITEVLKCSLSDDRLSDGFTVDFKGRFHALRGETDNDSSMGETVKSALERFLKQAQAKHGEISELSDEVSRQKALLAKRWAQIAAAIVKQAISQ